MFEHDYITKNACCDCNRIFPVLENFLLEARCPQCQAKFRLERSKRKPAEKEYERRIRQDMQDRHLW